MTNLIDALKSTYGPPCRQPDAPPGDDTRRRFTIDDQNADDHYQGFCKIYATVLPEVAKLVLELKDCPHNDEVAELVKGAGGKIERQPWGATISVTLWPINYALVRTLAKAIRRVTRRGQRYPERNWKWTTRRTAAALEKFARQLAQTSSE